MSHSLASRADLRRAFHRLVGSSDQDSALTEHDNDPGDTVNGWLQTGLWEAQHYVISQVAPNRWTKRWSVASSDWEGSDQTGGKYIDLPTDFMRLDGTHDASALYRPNGDRWGTMIDPLWRTRRGSFYFVENDRLKLTRLAKPPNPVEVAYFYRHPNLTSDDNEVAAGTIDFPVEDRPLIVGYAAQEASLSSLFPGSQQAIGKIGAYVKRWERRVYERGRRSREPRKVKHSRALGNRFLSRGT